jgi:hypothetical protein
MVEGARQKLGSFSALSSDLEKIPVKIDCKRERNEVTTGAGSGIVLWAELEGGGMVGGSALGRKGIDPAAVGAEAAMELIRGLEAGGCVDEVCHLCGFQEQSLNMRFAVVARPNYYFYGTGVRELTSEVWSGRFKFTHSVRHVVISSLPADT